MYKRKKDKKQQLSEYEDDSVYAAEKLLDKRKRYGKIEYLVYWRGWSLSDSTWEPVTNILDDRLIKEFEKNRAAKKEAQKSKKPIPPSKQAKKASKSNQPDSTSGPAEERSASGDDDEVNVVDDEVIETPDTNEQRATEQRATEQSNNEEASEAKDESTSAIESESVLQPEQPDQPTVQVEEANEQEESFEVVLESDNDEEETGDRQPEEADNALLESSHAKSGQLQMASEICSPEISAPSATITRNPMLFNQLVNKKMASPTKAGQGSLIRTDTMGTLSPISQRRNASPFRPTTSQSSMQSRPPPNSVQICRPPSVKQSPSVKHSPPVKQPSPVKQVHLVHSLQREELEDPQCRLNTGLNPRHDPIFEQTAPFAVQGRLTNRQSNASNHQQTQFYHSPPSPSASYRTSSSHQFKQVTNPMSNGIQSSPFRSSHPIGHQINQHNNHQINHQIGHQINHHNNHQISQQISHQINHQIGHSLVNVVQPIPHERADFSFVTQQQSVPSASRSLESRQAINEQLEEQLRPKSFQETSNAILNSSRPAKRHVVPPNIFWRQNSLVNQIVITDVISDDNVAVTIRECKKKEFFMKGKKKKIKHKLKMMKLI